MSSQLYISIPVTNLAASATFYEKLGFTPNAQFSDETNKCLMWNESIFLMIMTHNKFKTFTDKPIMDPTQMVSAGYSLSVESVDKVHEMVNNGIAGGGTEVGEMKDYGFMQERSIEDPDGYNWGIFYMDMSKFPGNQA